MQGALVFDSSHGSTPSSLSSFGGIGSTTTPSVSGRVVWLGGYVSLGCADPDTGALRAQVPVGTDKRGDVIASISGLTVLNQKVYAVYSGVNGGPKSALIVMTPPAKCFGR